MALAAVSCFAMSAATSAHALDCPIPQNAAKAGVIAEPEKTIAAMAPLLSAPNAAERAPEIVAQVRKRHPKAQSAEIVNFLITAYCPIANARNIGEPEKRALVEAFAGAVTQQVY